MSHCEEQYESAALIKTIHFRLDLLLSFHMYTQSNIQIFNCVLNEIITRERFTAFLANSKPENHVNH